MTSVGSETSFTVPIVGVRIWFDDDHIIGMQLVGSDCVCHLLRYQFDGEDIGVWPESYSYTISDPPVTFTWSYANHPSSSWTTTYPDLANSCTVADVTVESDWGFDTFNVSFTENSLTISNDDVSWIGDSSKDFRVYPVWNDGSQSTMYLDVPLKTPCVNGWKQFPAFETVYNIPFG